MPLLYDYDYTNRDKTWNPMPRRYMRTPALRKGPGSFFREFGKATVDRGMAQGVLLGVVVLDFRQWRKFQKPTPP